MVVSVVVLETALVKLWNLSCVVCHDYLLLFLCLWRTLTSQSTFRMFKL